MEPTPSAAPNASFFPARLNGQVRWLRTNVVGPRGRAIRVIVNATRAENVIGQDLTPGRSSTEEVKESMQANSCDHVYIIGPTPSATLAMNVSRCIYREI